MKESSVHNHITRDIKKLGECWACDIYHYSHRIESLKHVLRSLIENMETHGDCRGDEDCDHCHAKIVLVKDIS